MQNYTKIYCVSEDVFFSFVLLFCLDCGAYITGSYSLGYSIYNKMYSIIWTETILYVYAHFYMMNRLMVNAYFDTVNCGVICVTQVWAWLFFCLVHIISGLVSYMPVNKTLRVAIWNPSRVNSWTGEGLGSPITTIMPLSSLGLPQGDCP